LIEIKGAAGVCLLRVKSRDDAVYLRCPRLPLNADMRAILPSLKAIRSINDFAIGGETELGVYEPATKGLLLAQTSTLLTGPRL